MGQYFWDTQLEYLKKTRTNMWNDDYLEFLVRNVWHLDSKPINTIDFGCGYGFIGMKLLPLLPAGSTYTGVDKGAALLREAESLFEKAAYQARFIEADLVQAKPADITLGQRYDLAICQAVLRHIPQWKIVLEKMIEAVVPGGRVICIEVNRAMEESGFFASCHAHDTLAKTVEMKRQWDAEKQAGGRDYKTGIKVPMYMQKLGLTDIGVRVNDHVEFISPLANAQTYQDDIATMLHAKGLPPEHDDDTYITSAGCLLISYGTKGPAG